jgi:acyl-CoA synthetase (AMP-forming)/AMP-acid ligase II
MRINRCGALRRPAFDGKLTNKIGGKLSHPYRHAAATPDKIAVQMAGSGEHLTYAQLDARSNQGAHLLRGLGLQTGGHVALLLENRLEFLQICWAAQRSGLYYTPISRFLKPDEIAFILADSAARVLIVSPTTWPVLAGADLPAGLQVFTLGPAQPGLRSWTVEAASLPQTPIGDQSTGVDMLYSSGTTGRPKGVKAALRGQPIEDLHPLLKVLGCDMIGMDANTIYLSPAPLYHAAPLRFTMLACAIGATTIVMEKFEPEQFLNLIAIHGVTHTQVVPTMFVRLLKLPPETRARADISTLRGAIHAAAPCPPDVKAAMIAWWGPILLEYYAGTEGNGATVITSSEWLNHRGSVGRAAAGSIKIIDDESGAVLPVGEIGSIYFAGGPAFEYHNNAAATARAHTKQGWSTLGDIGYLDADGYLYLTDRKAYTIISGGVNIYPQETEDVLIGHPAVMDVAVFGIPDEDLGERVHAIVQPIDVAQSGAALEAELIAYCQARLSKLKCPARIEFADELPRTPTGKLLKRLLRDAYWKK